MTPDGRWRAETRHAMGDEIVKGRARLEAFVERHDRRARVPGRKETRPGVFRPARRGNVEVDIAWLEPQPEHRRQMADGVGLMTVQNELRPRGGARGKVEQQWVVGMGRTAWREGGIRLAKARETQPSGRRFTDGDTRHLVGEAGEFAGVS